MSTSDAAPARGTISIRVQVATVLVVMVVAVGGLFAWLGYRQSSTILWSASERVFDEVAAEVHSVLVRTYAPVDLAIDLLSRSPLMAAGNREERLAGLGMLVEALRNSPQLSAIYAGYPGIERRKSENMDKTARASR